MVLHDSAADDLEGRERDRSISPGSIRQPLWLAAKYGKQTSIVKGRFAEINATDTEGCTALWWAAKNGYTEIVKKLLRMSMIDVNKPGPDSRTPLHEAAFHGHIEIVSDLIMEVETDVNCKDYILDLDSLDPTHHTPLHIATL
jgi:ankyrin repeat protein